jgi:hypothetical protein
MSELPFDHSHDDEDYDPDHPDLQHEPPEEVTSAADDTEEGEGETDGGDLPYQIPDPPRE